MVTSLLSSITISEACNAAGATLLTVLAALPDSALLTPKEAAAYIRSTAEVLRVWRHRNKGPRFCGRGHFIRYKKADLDDFMRGFDHRFLSESEGSAAKALPTVSNVASDDEYTARNGNVSVAATGLKSVDAVQPITTRGNKGDGKTAHTEQGVSGRSQSDAPARAGANAQRTSKS
jgi:hypothetical protein